MLNKLEDQFNQLFEELVIQHDDNSADLKKKDFHLLEKKIDNFLENTSQIKAGTYFEKFMKELEKIKKEIKASAKKIAGNNGNELITSFKTRIRDLIKKFQKEQELVEQIREEVLNNFEAKINKIGENIKLDFEFLFDRYTRRVSLNIGSKFFDLIKLEDDFEIRNFLLDSIFTCNRLTNDLQELSTTFDGQITKLINELDERTGIDNYSKIKHLKLNKKDFDFQKMSYGLPQKVETKTIFSHDSELVREILSTILFSPVRENADTIYEIMQNKSEVNKLSDNKIKKYMKIMEKQLADLLKKMNIEIDNRIEDKLYPVRSYFAKFQDMIFGLVCFQTDMRQSLYESIKSLDSDIMTDRNISNYQLLKELLS